MSIMLFQTVGGGWTPLITLVSVSDFKKTFFNEKKEIANKTIHSVCVGWSKPL